MDHISWTQLDMLLRCGIQYDFRYIQGKKIPPNGAIVRGSCGHKSIEKNFIQKVKSQIDLPQEEVKAFFSDEWERRKFEIVWSNEELNGDSPTKAEGKWKDSGIRLVSIYHDEQSPLVQPVEIEHEFSVQFEGDYPKMIGIIDRITDDDSVEDDKFTGKTPPEDDAAKDVQLTLYHIGYQTKFGKPPKTLRKRFAVDLKKPKTVIREAPPREQDQINRFLFRLEAAMKSIKTGIFVPCANTWWGCSPNWCGYYRQCNYHI